MATCHPAASASSNSTTSFARRARGATRPETPGTSVTRVPLPDFEEESMRTKFIAMAVAPLALATACWHATELAATWREPSAGPISFQRTVAVFVTKDETVRRTVEDRLAGTFANTTPSYRVAG